jgi:hypothetical protein
MRRLLRDMRFLAAELARRDMSNRAITLLEMTEQLPTISEPGLIGALRARLLTWRLEPKLQDDLSIVLAQLRAIEYGLEETGRS